MKAYFALAFSPRFRLVFREVLIAAVLGGAGFGLNMLELQLGWGMHFIFGNALIFAFLRTLQPATIVAATAIASFRSVLLWHHPWAWILWSAEAVILSAFIRRQSPIVIDAAFWLILGAPWLIWTYGGLMDMDQLSVFLVIAKQMSNGILNVALGEAIFAAALAFGPHRRVTLWPRVPVEALVQMILTLTILVPTTVYLSLDAPNREQGARTVLARVLADQLAGNRAAFEAWRQAHSEMLVASVDELQRGSLRTDPLLRRFLDDFDRVEGFDARGRRLWSVGDGVGLSPEQAQRAFASSSKPFEGIVLSFAEPAFPSGDRQAIVVPFIDASGERKTILAMLAPGLLKQVLYAQRGHVVDGTFLLGPAGRTLFEDAPPYPVNDRRAFLSLQLSGAEVSEARLISRAGYGQSLMRDLKEAQLVRSAALDGMPGWLLVASIRLNPEVLKARQGQLQLFMAVGCLLLLLICLGAYLGRRIRYSLRQLAQSAADVALSGAPRERIDSLVIRELSDISVNLATAGSEVARNRGAFVSHQRRLRSIASHAPVVVYALDAGDRARPSMLYVSEAIERLLGYAVEEISAPDQWYNAIHPDDRQRYLDLLTSLHPGNSYHIEYRMRRKHGDDIWVYDSLAIESDAYFHNEEVVGLIMNISDRKLAMAQLQQADKMASLGRMVAGIAHELNQPLNFIKMAALNLCERAASGHLDAERIKDKLEKILSHLDRASAIILQMRVFGRLPKEDPSPIDLKDAIDEVLTMVGPQLEADGIRIDASGCRTGVSVRAHPVLLEQVLLNLLLNSQDAIQARKKSSRKGVGKVQISVAAKGGQAEIMVEDNGVGIAHELLPSLFEPFFTTKPPKQGTGLGLSISYGIIRDLGGDIIAKDTGHGARFLVLLPLDEDAKLEARSAVALEAVRRGSVSGNAPTSED